MMAENLISYKSAIRSTLTLNFILILLLQLILTTYRVNGSDEWMQDCGVCHCKWISSKKNADCKQKSLVTVPKELSNELQVIDLSHNEINELHRNEFKDANLYNIHKIFMKNCSLVQIHRDAFQSLQLLIELDLSDNSLTVLEPGTFADVIRLRVVYVNNNKIQRLDDHLFENLTFLSKVYFKHNLIDYVGHNTFVNVSELREIYLDNNSLTVLYEDTFRKLDKLIDLVLIGNPWNCTCELQPLQAFLKTRNLYHEHTTCNEPVSLRGKSWQTIPADSFACRPTILLPRDGSTIDANNDNITLTCRIKGTPKPDVTWTYANHPVDVTEPRISIRTSQEINRRESIDVYISELIITEVKHSDQGVYTCLAQNNGGKAKADVRLAIPTGSEVIAGANVGAGVMGTPSSTPSTIDNNNLLLIICMIAIILLALLIIVVLILCCYCRRVKKYSKNGSISENGLMSNKIDKSQDSSILEGSVIMEMQKSLLTEVNPVEKPPRRNEFDSNGDLVEDGFEMKKTLLDESAASK